MKRTSQGATLALLGITLLLAMALPASSQCLPGMDCGSGGCGTVPQISTPLAQFSRFLQPEQGNFSPVDKRLEAACKINGASGTLVSRGDDWGVIFTCAHGQTPQRTTCEFPATGEELPAKLIAIDKETDVALYQTDGRPKARGAKVSTQKPAPGDVIVYGGFGPSRQWQAFRGQYLGTVLQRSTDRGVMDGGVRWRGSARPGDSGGPVWGPDGGLFSLITGTGNGESTGPSIDQLCQLIDDNRFALPWNADLAGQKSRNESEIAREAQRTEQERIRAEASRQQATPVLVPGGPGVDQEARISIDRLAAMLAETQKLDAAQDQAIEELQGSVATGRDLVERLGLLGADVDTVAKAADVLTGKVAAAEAKAAEAEAKAAEAAKENAGLGEKLKDAVEKASGAVSVAEGIKEGIAGKAKEAVIGLAMTFGPWGFGLIGVAVFVLYKVIKKDIRDFVENGDPLIIQKIASRVPGQLDDRAADFIADRIMRRWGPPPAAPVQQK